MRSEKGLRKDKGNELNGSFLSQTVSNGTQMKME
jgi:hypothetical protein